MSKQRVIDSMLREELRQCDVDFVAAVWRRSGALRMPRNDLDYAQQERYVRANISSDPTHYLLEAEALRHACDQRDTENGNRDTISVSTGVLAAVASYFFALAHDTIPSMSMFSALFIGGISWFCCRGMFFPHVSAEMYRK